MANITYDVLLANIIARKVKMARRAKEITSNEAYLLTIKGAVKHALYMRHAEKLY